MCDAVCSSATLHSPWKLAPASRRLLASSETAKFRPIPLSVTVSPPCLSTIGGSNSCDILMFALFFPVVFFCMFVLFHFVWFCFVRSFSWFGRCSMVGTRPRINLSSSPPRPPRLALPRRNMCRHRRRVSPPRWPPYRRGGR